MARPRSNSSALLIALLTAPNVWAGAHRFARVGDLQGAPEVQLHASDGWRAAVRNLPLPEGARLRTAVSDNLEIELDDGSFLRLTGGALAEFSDYTQLSTGQRLTLLSLDHGLAYFTGEPAGHDTLSLAVPGAQITLRHGSRLRLEAADQGSTVAVIEGVVRLSMPTVELDLRGGQMVRVDPGNASRFTLLREIPKLESDSWSEGRDRATAVTTSGAYIAAAYGLADLDHAGAWITTPEVGLVWKPRIEDAWRPFRDGKWEWLEEAGYTWISAEPWGWLPYHYGRWIQDASLGWVWSPDRRPHAIYKPGDVYWLRGGNHIAWGPLAPGEDWTGSGRSQWYALANTTLAPFSAGAREIDPGALEPRFAAKPGDALAAMAFTIAPPSPPWPARRLDAERPELRTAQAAAMTLSSVAPEIPSMSYQSPQEVSTAAPPPAPPPFSPAEVAPNVDDEAPTPQLETFYAVPSATGIVIVDPPLQAPDGGMRSDHASHAAARPVSENRSGERHPTRGAEPIQPPASDRHGERPVTGKPDDNTSPAARPNPADRPK